MRGWLRKWDKWGWIGRRGNEGALKGILRDDLRACIDKA